MSLSPEMRAYWKNVMNKVIESATSVKVNMFYWPFIAMTYFLFYMASHMIAINNFVDLPKIFELYCTTIVALAGTVIVVRQVFHTEDIRPIFNSEGKMNTEGVSRSDLEEEIRTNLEEAAMKNAEALAGESDVDKVKTILGNITSSVVTKKEEASPVVIEEAPKE